jgi:DNA-binding transcriptional MerR regulator
MTMTDTSRSISQVAEITGLSTHTLRYYEREGLMLTPVDRASSTHRRYGDADIGWVEFLTKLRRTAMPIAEVRRYVELVREGDFTTIQRLELLREHRLAVLTEIAEMKKSLAAIDFKIALYEEKAVRREG